METPIAIPILKNNNFVGLIGVDIGLEKFKAIVGNLKPFKTGYAFLLSNKGYYIYHPDTITYNKTFAEVNPYEDSLYNISKKIQEGKEIKVIAEHTNTGQEVMVFLTPIKIGNTQTFWSFGILVFLDDVLASSRKTIGTTIISGIIGFILILVVVILISRNIINSVRNGVKAAKHLLRLKEI